MNLKTKRVYEEPSKGDGVRVLIDRIWPRGLRKEDARIDLWLKDLAPSTELRKWFGHDPARWQGFRERYFQELYHQADALQELRERASRERVTLVYAAKDSDHSNAAALAEYLRTKK